VDRDHEADHLEVGTTVLHVQRGHDHHRHHGRVRARHRDHGRTDRRHVADDLDEAPPRAPGRLDDPAGRHPGRVLGHEQRVGPQPQPDPAGGEHEDDRADGEPAGELRDPAGARHRTADPDQVGAGHGADRRRPDHDRQGTRTVLLGRQVGGGVARRAVDRRRGTQQDGAEQQHQHRVDDAGDDREHCTRGAEEVAGDQADATPAPAHHPRQGVRRSRGAQDLEGLCQPGHRLAAGDVAGQERGGRHPDGHADGTDRLGDDERADRTTLDVGEVMDVGPGPGAHRSRSGSSSWRHTAAQTCFGGTPASIASWVVRPSRSRTTVTSAHVRE
jgi:hypothetical protein